MKRFSEEDEAKNPLGDFDYTKIKFPKEEKLEVDFTDRDGSDYMVYCPDFDELNKDWLNGKTTVFTISTETYGKWVGKYWPGSYYEPPEYPEYEIDEVVSDISYVEIGDNDDLIDITDVFPSKEKAVADGNEEWYKEYEFFSKNLCEYVEEKEYDRVMEDPPEQEPEDYWDDDDRDW